MTVRCAGARSHRNPKMWGKPQPGWVLDVKDIHKGKRAFLESQVTFTCNRYPKWPEAPFAPAYHCLTERRTVEAPNQFDIQAGWDTVRLAFTEEWRTMKQGPAVAFTTVRRAGG